MSSTKQHSARDADSTAFPGLPVIPPNDPSLTKPLNEAVPRQIKQSILAVSQSEGVGARVRRSIGTPKLRNFSPFLMLDHFSISPGAGFPDHPHRGQETITYLLSGAVDHEDFAGNKGTIETGDLQFMTAGKGIVHAEMPRQNADGSPNVGLQLWVDLPKALKYCEPRYRDLRAAEIPVYEGEGVTVKVISGTSHGVESLKELAYTPVWLLDVTLQPGAQIKQPIPAAWSTFMYTLSGTISVNGRSIPQYHTTTFEAQGDVIDAAVEEGAPEAARFVIVAGLEHGHRIVQYGPFVLNSEDEVYEALRDYQTYSNGFERAEGWESEIGKSMVH